MYNNDTNTEFKSINTCLANTSNDIVNDSLSIEQRTRTVISDSIRSSCTSFEQAYMHQLLHIFIRLILPREDQNVY